MTEDESKPEEDALSPTDGVLNEVVPKLSKTPFFQAVNAARYQRQALIREIEDLTGTKVICYTAGLGSPVHREDTVCFVDLLHNIAPDTDIDLVLHTGGGDIDAAEKLVNMVRKRVGSGKLRVIVPDYAKSAGTLMVLGADQIVMSDTSELGPIDPQIIMADGNGNRVSHSVKNYLDAYEEHNKKLTESPDDITARIMLSKLDPATVQLFKNVWDRARKFAETQLQHGMMKDTGNWSQAVDQLLNQHKFQTHGQPISWEDAADPKIGLNIAYLPPQDEVWQLFWQLYCLQRLAVGEGQKLFESLIASLCIDSLAAQKSSH